MRARRKRRLSFDPRYGEAVPVGNAITRITANNPGSFTGAGTNTYLIGEERLMLLDPGPDLPEHLALIGKAIRGRPVSHILVTHSHRDHIEGLQAVRDMTGAPVVAEGPARLSRTLHPSEVDPRPGYADRLFPIDHVVSDGETISNGEVSVTAVTTPGHAPDHVAFAYGDDFFSGDHVMGWSTTVVSPPEGSMRAYVASLEKIMPMGHTRYLPGHGDMIDEPARTVSGIRSHRLMRERAILQRLQAGDRAISDIVANLYSGIDRSLYDAAAMSVLAHLEMLYEQGRVFAEGYGKSARWRPSGV